MIYGPVDLPSASDLEFNLNVFRNSESGFDFVCWATSVDLNLFYGPCASGTTGGVFVPATLDLTSVPTLGDLRGHTGVYLGVLFRSDVSDNFAEGPTWMISCCATA